MGEDAEQVKSIGVRRLAFEDLSANIL